MHSFLDPAILFFLFGLAAGALRSNLEIPQPISRFLSLYLLMALGLKGGFALAASGVGGEVAVSLACAVLLAVVTPLIGYRILNKFVSGYDAAAIAATFGSVSAVTFITATQFLEARQIDFGGHMAAAMALMESPAIVIAVVFANRLRQTAPAHVCVGPGVAALHAGPPHGSGIGIGKLLHESFTDGAQLLLLGSLAIGMITGDAGKAVMQPFSGDLFKGMLAFFLLDMGLLAARSMSSLRGKSPLLFVYAIVAPLFHAALALGLAMMFQLSPGNATLLMVLAASASYIAVPAAIRIAIPEANPSLYVGMSLVITFPFNILAGIPLYSSVANSVLGTG